MNGMKKLQCEVCGGRIIMRAGEKDGVCECCDMHYTIERMREIYSGTKVSVTGSSEDVEQWQALLKVYMDNFDYQSALPIAKKILEAQPNNMEARLIYREINDNSRYFVISQKCLVKYNGPATKVVVPEGVVRIHKGAFKDALVEEVHFPDSLVELGPGVFDRGCIGYSYLYHPVKKIVFGKGLEKIDRYAFGLRCSSLTTLVFPTSFAAKDIEFLWEQGKIETINAAPSYLDYIFEVYANTDPGSEYMHFMFPHSPWFTNRRQEKWIREGRCRYCGGKIGFMRKCTVCKRKQ